MGRFRRTQGSDNGPGGQRRRRLPTGVPGLDEVLGGGFFEGGIYLLTGGPGTGKTVLANQLCFARAREGQRCLYVTLLAESHSRMICNLETLSFFDTALLEDGITYVSAARITREEGLAGLFGLVQEEIHRRRPALLILDGFRMGVRMAAVSRIEHTEFLNQLAALLEFTDCTAVVSTLAEPGVMTPEYAMADGLLELSHRALGRRGIRELFVQKSRGSTALGGTHVLEIDERGAVVYPRTEATLAREIHVPSATGERLTLGIERLDEMLQGGVPSGSTTAVLGATGAGKTLLGLHFLSEGAKRSERGLYFGFYESPDRVLAQGVGVGLPVKELCREGHLEVIWNRPFEHHLDRLVAELRDHVRQQGIQRLFIDGVDGLERGSAFPESSPTVLAALTNELRALGVTTLVSVEGELLGKAKMPSALWSALVENVIALRYVELRSHLRRLIWIVKVRGSNFDSSLREFTISDRGIQIADTFESAEAILSGTAQLPARMDEPGEGNRR